VALRVWQKRCAIAWAITLSSSLIPARKLSKPQSSIVTGAPSSHLLGLENAFHGKTLGAIQLTSSYREPYSLFGPDVRLLDPDDPATWAAAEAEADQVSAAYSNLFRAKVESTQFQSRLLNGCPASVARMESLSWLMKSKPDSAAREPFSPRKRWEYSRLSLPVESLEAGWRRLAL